jgi:hypothetical protein
MTPVLYVVKPPIETVSSWHHRLSIDSFQEVGRPWHHWQITENVVATTKVPRIQSQIFYFHPGKIKCGLLFPNSWPKNLCAAYTRANTVLWERFIIIIISEYYILSCIVVLVLGCNWPFLTVVKHVNKWIEFNYYYYEINWVESLFLLLLLLLLWV